MAASISAMVAPGPHAQVPIVDGHLHFWTPDTVTTSHALSFHLIRYQPTRHPRPNDDGPVTTRCACRLVTQLHPKPLAPTIPLALRHSPPVPSFAQHQWLREVQDPEHPFHKFAQLARAYTPATYLEDMKPFDVRACVYVQCNMHVLGGCARTHVPKHSGMAEGAAGLLDVAVVGYADCTKPEECTDPSPGTSDLQTDQVHTAIHVHKKTRRRACAHMDMK